MSDDESDDEASPNVEHLLQQAFAKADPAPSLLQVVKEHPTYEYIEFPLVKCYVEAVEENPSRGQVLASSLTRLDTLSADIKGELDRAVHFKEYFDKEVKDYGPKNKFLFHSLLSGLSLKNRLTQNSVMYAAIEKGLDPHGSDQPLLNSENPEVLVVGACIQLLLNGSVLPTETAGPRYRRSAEVVAKNLKDQKVAGTVKDPHAIQVLELAISHAETGLKPENDRDDVWVLLFPSKF
jgi:hypothetical protein